MNLVVGCSLILALSRTVAASVKNCYYFHRYASDVKVRVTNRAVLLLSLLGLASMQLLASILVCDAEHGYAPSCKLLQSRCVIGKGSLMNLGMHRTMHRFWGVGCTEV